MSLHILFAVDIPARRVNDAIDEWPNTIVVFANHEFEVDLMHSKWNDNVDGKCSLENDPFYNTEFDPEWYPYLMNSKVARVA
jgi:hypothetical protein